MHPALIILTVVFTVHTTNLVGRDRIQSFLLPVYLRLFYASDVKLQKELKKSIWETRQQLNKTSSQDEFAKWAKLRRNVDKQVSSLEVTNTRIASANSTLSLLLRVVLFLATTLFPFVLTFYFGKTPMFFLPPSGTSSTSTPRTIRTAPGGFVLPNSPNHAWDMVNETYLGPFGWFLSLTAAPRGSVSAGMWSTICTRVALLLTDRIRESFTAVSTIVTSKSSAAAASSSSTTTETEATIQDEKKADEKQSAASQARPSEGVRKRTTATAAS